LDTGKLEKVFVNQFVKKLRALEAVAYSFNGKMESE
jgi:hypothetical protein